MRAISARLAAIAASFIMAALAARGVGELPADFAERLQAVLGHVFELVLIVGYAVVHPWLQKRWNPTGAFTGEAARKLEMVAHVDSRR